MFIKGCTQISLYTINKRNNNDYTLIGIHSTGKYSQLGKKKHKKKLKKGSET